MTVYRVKPYREAWFKHLLRLQFRTAFCALFGITRFKATPRRVYLPVIVGIDAARIRERIAELESEVAR